jgi:very-short-patch-repair endonuclease
VELLTETLRELGGVATTADLLRVVGRRRLATAVAAQEVVRIGRGLYALPALHRDRADEAAALRARGVLSHVSAARWHGLSLKNEPERPVVTVPRNRNVPIEVRDSTDVRYGKLPAEDVDGLVTTPLRTVIDCARSLPFDEALAVADSALNRGAVSAEQLEAGAAASPRTGRPQAMRVAETADGRAANAFESVVRAISTEVPALHLVPQVEILRGVTSDLVDRSLRIVVECDSWTYHAEKSAFHHDLERHNSVTLAGWLLLRFDRMHATERPDYVRRELAAAVHARTI